MLKRIRESNGFFTKTGQILDFTEWHSFSLSLGLALGYLTPLQDVFAAALMVTVSLAYIGSIGRDISKKVKMYVNKEPLYHLYGALTGFAVVALVKSLPEVLQVVHVCL